jgi:hypothetical protein
MSQLQETESTVLIHRCGILYSAGKRARSAGKALYGRQWKLSKLVRGRALLDKSVKELMS